MDVRRTIDFLETRNDIRSDRVGFHGASWGGLMAPIVLAIEPRIKAAVLYSAGYGQLVRPLPERQVPLIPRADSPLVPSSGAASRVWGRHYA